MVGAPAILVVKLNQVSPLLVEAVLPLWKEKQAFSGLLSTVWLKKKIKMHSFCYNIALGMLSFFDNWSAFLRWKESTDKSNTKMSTYHQVSYSH